MIKQIIVTDRETAKVIVPQLKKLGEKVAWITIANDQKKRLVSGGNKHTLPLFFDDITDKTSRKAFTKNLARKVKNFIFNHHINNSQEFILVVNCMAGVSRSSAIGKFAELKFGIPARFTELEAKRIIAPNHLVLKLLGMERYTKDDSLTEYHEDYRYEDYGSYRGFI